MNARRARAETVELKCELQGVSFIYEHPLDAVALCACVLAPEQHQEES